MPRAGMRARRALGAKGKQTKETKEPKEPKAKAMILETAVDFAISKSAATTPTEVD